MLTFLPCMISMCWLACCTRILQPHTGHTVTLRELSLRLGSSKAQGKQQFVPETFRTTDNFTELCAEPIFVGGINGCRIVMCDVLHCCFTSDDICLSLWKCSTGGAIAFPKDTMGNGSVWCSHKEGAWNTAVDMLRWHHNRLWEWRSSTMSPHSPHWNTGAMLNMSWFLNDLRELFKETEDAVSTHFDLPSLYSVFTLHFTCCFSWFVLSTGARRLSLVEPFRIGIVKLRLFNPNTPFAKVIFAKGRRFTFPR